MESQHYLKRTRRRKFSVSPRLAQLTKEFLDGGGKWQQFKVGDLFDLKGIKQAKSQNLIPKSSSSDFSVNYIIQSTQNNMFKMKADRNWLEENNEPPVNGNAIVLGVTLPAVSYQPDEFGASQVITARANFLDENIGLYFVSIFERQMLQFSYTHKPGIEIYKNLNIPLPSLHGEIAFDFMRRYIATLKAERVATLKAYLQAAGLSNTILTEGERAALGALRQNHVKWREIPICGKDGAFNVSNTHCVLKAQILPGSGNIPYVGAGESNNSIQSYISYSPDFIERGNSIMIGGKTLVITYQEEDYVSNDSHNLSLYYKDIENPNRNLQLFLVSALYRSLKPKYHWGDSISKSKIKSDTIMLPIIKNGTIDYNFINGLISAQIKLCILNVLNTKDLEISNTEQIVENEPNTAYAKEYSYPSLAAEPYEVYRRSDFTETVLIGCYRDKKHLKWILANHIYNIRMGKRKGSAEDKPECFGLASRLYLYDLQHPDKVSVFSIVDHKEMFAAEMKEMGYPKKSPSKSYMTFKIEEIGNNEDVYNLNITEILTGLENHVNGEPVFIEPEKI